MKATHEHYMNTDRRIRLIAAVVATLALVACSIPTEGLSLAVTQRQPLVPLQEYRGWWEIVEACSSRSGDFDLVRWYEASGIVVRGEVALGLWEPPHDITVVNTVKENAFIVRHEMLHDILGGDPDHKDEAWLRCNLETQGSSRPLQLLPDQAYEVSEGRPHPLEFAPCIHVERDAVSEDTFEPITPGMMVPP